MDWRLSSGDVGPHVHLTTPASFSFGWPLTLPRALPPPIKERSFRSPFGIDKTLFNAALHPAVPITIASIYIVSVLYLNSYNARNGNKPWAISRKPFFKRFVVAHNVLLAVYSLATFAAMVRAAIQVWPAADNNTGLAGVADAFCKIHGPRGLGDAATYNSTINIWEVKNTIIKLGYDGNPDPTDAGRLWNEGLAFWGWIFYVSKFYEVVDTMIIVAKGKRSATLQTYHHSGAMLCMWAGIRYMSPPIWMFVFINSFIHGLMYTYFALAALEIRVPPALKRLLTTMQIAQFVWGASYAAAHLFIKYDIPISTPYQVASIVKAAASSVSSAASAASSTASAVIESPAASGTLLALAKKLILRAIGEEGIAEHVTNKQGEPLNEAIQEQIQAFNERTETSYETKWRTELTQVNCLDTSGEAFAVYLNLFYLAPLTWLFGRFFVRAYTNYGKPRNPQQAVRQTRDSGREAKIRTEERVEQTGRRAEGKISKIADEFHKDFKAVQDGTFKEGRAVSQKVSEASEKAQEKTKELSQKAQTKTQELSQKAQSKTEELSEKAKQSANNSRNNSPKKKKKAQEQTKASMSKSETEDSSESAQKQDRVLAESQAARPGVKAEDDSKINALTSGSEPAAESAAKQDENIKATQDIRPGVKGEESVSASTDSLVAEGLPWFPRKDDDDTDAMGKSGAIVDFAAAKAAEAAGKANEVKEDVEEVVKESAKKAKS